MKRLLLFAGFALFTSPSLFAMKKAEGYYVSEQTGKKYQVTFMIPIRFPSSEPNYEVMQTEVIYLLEDGKSHSVLKPENATEISFTYKNKTTLMRSVYDNFSEFSTNNNIFKADHEEFVFPKVVVDGPVALYDYYSSNISPSHNPSTGMPMGSVNQQRVQLVSKDVELFHIRQFFFKNDVRQFFSDCPELIRKVESGNLSKVAEVVTAYNEHCIEPK